MLPFLEVSHLPSSTSFYSAVTQALGLRYLSAGSEQGIPTVTFGAQTPVFQLREVNAHSSAQPLKHSRIVLSAGSPEVVKEFYSFALRAYPGSSASLSTTGSLADGPHSGLDNGSVVPGGSGAFHLGSDRARVSDLDGNRMEVVYVPPQSYPAEYGGSTVRRTQSTHDEVNRIMDWNYDVAASSPPSRAAESAMALARRPGRHFDDAPGATILRRSVTTTSVLDPKPSPREGSRGLTTAGVVGFLGAAVGVAAGAAVTYSMIKSSDDRGRAGPQDGFEAPTFQRRATFPDPYPDRLNRVVEVERTVEKIRYPDEYTPVAERRPPPTMIARYSQVEPSRYQGVEDLGAAADDGRSRHSSVRYRANPISSVRTRSEAPSGREPLLLTEADHRSYASSKHSAAQPPRSVHSARRSSYDTAADRESYVSARSRRSSSTVRPPAPTAQTMPPSTAPPCSRAGSRATKATVKVPAASSASMHRPGLDRARSYVSARHVALPPSEASAHRVPLPPSGVGSSHADWDDDAGSVAPSDSISCVGSRRSTRSYR